MSAAKRTLKLRRATLTNKKAKTSVTYVFCRLDETNYVTTDSLPASVYPHVPANVIVELDDGTKAAALPDVIYWTNRHICDAFADCDAQEAGILRALANDCDTMARTRNSRRKVAA